MIDATPIFFWKKHATKLDILHRIFHHVHIYIVSI